MRSLYRQKCDHADLLPAVPSVTTLNFRRPPSVTTLNFSVTMLSCTPHFWAAMPSFSASLHLPALAYTSLQKDRSRTITPIDRKASYLHHHFFNFALVTTI